MAQFTIQLKDIPYVNFASHLQDYDIFESSYRDVLNAKIYKTCRFREIGFETPEMFLEHLDVWMALNMPDYNHLYRMKFEELSPTQRQAVIQTIERDRNLETDSLYNTNRNDKNDSSSSSTITSSSENSSEASSESESLENNTGTSQSSSSGTNKDTSTATSESEGYNSDFPQANLEGAQADSKYYSSGQEGKGTDSGESESTTTGESDSGFINSSNGTGSSSDTSSSESSSLSSTESESTSTGIGTSSTVQDIDSIEYELETLKKNGNLDRSEFDLMEQYKKVFINVDLKLITALKKDLFMNMWYNV